MSMIEGIQAIRRKIEEDAKSHCDERYAQIISDAEAEIEGENASIRDDYEKRREMLKRHNGLEYERLLERIENRLNRELLEYQRDLADEIFAMAAAKLRNVTREEFSCMFRSAVKGLKGNYELLLGELTAACFDAGECFGAGGGVAVMAVDGKAGEADGLRFTLAREKIPGKSGFVLRDDRVEYNCLFEDLIADIKRERAAQIIKEVFEAP